MAQQLSPQTQKLISRYKLWYQSLQPQEGVSTIHVDEVASKVAGFYEKIRTIVDWKEEHLMRRAAIIRKIKRRLLGWDLNKFAAKEEIAEPLVLELIRGGHFPNDKIPETKISEIAGVINKYIFILKNSPESGMGREKLQFYNWIFEITACEIEETLAQFRREGTLIDYMFELMKERIVVNEGVISIGGLKEEQKNIQIYIAIQQALFKLDKPIISYNLIKYKYPQWKRASAEWLSEIVNPARNRISGEVKDIYKIWYEIEKDLSHPLAKKFYTICEKYDTPYLLLGDILSEENPEETAKKIAIPETLETLIKNAYNKRLFTLKARFSRAAFYSTLSILLTNSLSLIILEIPLAKLITGTFSPITILVDILGPTILMFLFTVTIRLPTESNLGVVLMETMKIVYKSERVDTYEVKITRKRGVFTKLIVSFIYLFGAFVSFGAVVWIFELAGFPPTSLVINIMFVALIVFAGLAIRKRAQELTVEERPTGFLGFLFDILFLPVAATGRWLSNNWKKYNAIAAFFNALIDMPFSIFVEFLEQWRYFLKEKKEEIH